MEAIDPTTDPLAALAALVAAHEAEGTPLVVSFDRGFATFDGFVVEDFTAAHLAKFDFWEDGPDLLAVIGDHADFRVVVGNLRDWEDA